MDGTLKKSYDIWVMYALYTRTNLRLSDNTCALCVYIKFGFLPHYSYHTSRKARTKLTSVRRKKIAWIERDVGQESDDYHHLL